MITEDLDTYLQDFGVTVVMGMVSGLGILDTPDLSVAGALTLSTEYSLLARTSEFGSARNGDEITVDGDEYLVREITKVDDGKFCRILLSKDDA